MKEDGTAKHLYRHPEYHHRGYGHADVGAPCREFELLLKDENDQHTKRAHPDDEHREYSSLGWTLNIEIKSQRNYLLAVGQ